MARVLLAQPEWDTDKPTFSWALACSDTALKLYRDDGCCDKKHIERARDLFRDALDRGADQRAIFIVWYSMELGHRDTAAARACFEEWRWRSRDGFGNAELWCHYAWFECQYGTRKRARLVAQFAAIAACPRNPEVFAMYVCVELCMGCDRHARLLVAHARDVVFAADKDAAKWIENEVEGYRRYLRDGRPTIGDIFRCLLFHHCSRGGSAY